MPAPYDVALRKRAVKLSDKVGVEEAAMLLEIGTASIVRWRRKRAKTGSVSPEKMGGDRRSKKAREAEEELVRQVQAQPDATSAELVQRVEKQTGRRLGLSTASRRLVRKGYRFKRKVVLAVERDSVKNQEKVQEFLNAVKDIPREKMVFIDEAGSNLAMTRLRGRALAGEQVSTKVPRNRGLNTTMIGALCLKGMRAIMTIECGTSTGVFSAFLLQVLIPVLNPGDVLFLDNAGAHKAQRIQAILRKFNIRALFLPPYSPEYNPIELAWSKIKERLRTAGARTRVKLRQAIGEAVDAVSSQDADGWFGHCGYPMQGQPA